MAEDVVLSGPLFDGRAIQDMAEGARVVRHKLAQEGQKLARMALTASIRVEHTGRAVAAITTTDTSTVFTSESGHHSYSLPVEVPAESEVVTTSLASYGPWLEGTGSRNVTERFRGYHYMRIAGDELDARAKGIAERELAPYVERMN